MVGVRTTSQWPPLNGRLENSQWHAVETNFERLLSDNGCNRQSKVLNRWQIHGLCDYNAEISCCCSGEIGPLSSSAV